MAKGPLFECSYDEAAEPIFPPGTPYRHLDPRRLRASIPSIRTGADNRGTEAIEAGSVRLSLPANVGPARRPAAPD